MSTIRPIVQYPASRTKKPYTIPVTDANGNLSSGVLSNVSEQSDLGNISGALSLDATTAPVQIGTVTGDITGFTITNLDGNPFMLQLDNTGEHGITLDAADYTLGSLPSAGIFTIYFYQVGTDIYAIIGDAYSEVV